MWVAYSGNEVHVDVYTGGKVSKNQMIREKIDTLHFKSYFDRLRTCWMSTEYFERRVQEGSDCQINATIGTYVKGTLLVTSMMLLMYISTRMHSCRLRTACCSGHHYMYWGWGFSVRDPPGQRTPGQRPHTPDRTPPPRRDMGPGTETPQKEHGTRNPDRK